MKVCEKCGCTNPDDGVFCANCGAQSLKDAAPVVTAPTAATVVPMPQPVPAPQPAPVKAKPKLGLGELFSILGLVASIIGMFCCSIVLHPIAAISAIIGFIKASRFKALALAAFVIAIVGGVVRILFSLNDAGVIPQWWVDGAFA